MAHELMIQTLTPRLMSNIEQGRALSAINHPGIKGRLRELFIQDMIRPFLPPSVTPLTGRL